MKFIHCADLHLDAKMETNLKVVQARARKQELLETFTKMVEYAKVKNIKVIIIAGDLFDTTEVTDKTMKYFLSVVRNNESIDFLYLNGNHEKDVLSKFINLYPDNLKTFSDTWKYYRYDDVVFCGKNVVTNDLELKEEDKNIVILHGQEFTSSTQQSSENNINLNELKDKNIDYLALGHIHKNKVAKLDKRGIYVYSGCLEGHGFDECGEKGFYEVDTTDFNPKFISIAKRSFCEINIDITGLEEYQIESEITSALYNINKDNGIRLIINGTYGIDVNIDEDKIQKDINEVFFASSVVNNSTLLINKEDYKHDVSLKGEFVRQVLDSGLKEEDIDEIIKMGIKALKGEQI